MQLAQIGHQRVETAATPGGDPPARFGGELIPNVVEIGSGLVFKDFFQNERDGGRKGIAVIAIGAS